MINPILHARVGSDVFSETGHGLEILVHLSLGVELNDYDAGLAAGLNQ